MINNWHIPRNKRQLYPVVDILALFNLHSIGQIWEGDLGIQLDFETELERYGLKAPGTRRDRRAGGARTYEAWLFNLGLIYTETGTGINRLTLAGEALLNGEPPVPILTNQLMKLQYPSAYSARSRVDINQRFRIRPFRFILRLLADQRIQFLSQSEIARFLLTEGENETNRCFEYIVEQVLRYRREGDAMLTTNFNELYPSSTNGVRTTVKTINALEDVANTFINYLNYTGLIQRVDGQISIFPEREIDVIKILNDGTSIRPFRQSDEFGSENFQRSLGLAPGQNRDNRNFLNVDTTEEDFMEQRIRNEFLRMSSITPIFRLSWELFEEIAQITGYSINRIQQALEDMHINTFTEFENQYIRFGSSGRDLATQFEMATANIFLQLGFNSEHIGPLPLHPDILITNESNSIKGIIDTKAYLTYSISNDHRNRMLSNYIPTFNTGDYPLDFFMYVADGFGGMIDSQIQKIYEDSNICGSAITSRLLLRLLEIHLETPISLAVLRDLFTINRQITLMDIDNLGGGRR